jgi:16S rRNA (cytidine1402-2'-O)-methyltransferase
VLVLHAAPRSAGSADEMPAEALRVLKLLMLDLPLKQAVALAAEITGEARNRLYEAALALKDSQAT